MEFGQIILFNLFAIIVFMVCVWGLSILKKDASIADIFWGLGFVMVAWFTFFSSEGYSPRGFFVVFMTTLWGLRLSIHLFIRSHGRGEDPRYKAMRAAHGKSFWIISLFSVFLLQGIILWIVSLVIQVPLFFQKTVSFSWLDAVGILLCCSGFIFETIADKQLYSFKSDPANQGKVMDQGLWAYSRHPNYFGEALIWWGFYTIAINHPGKAWVIVSPVLITFLLLKVSGITLMEKTIQEKRPDYADYIKRTSAFFPWFPRKGDS